MEKKKTTVAVTVQNFKTMMVSNSQMSAIHTVWQRIISAIAFRTPACRSTTKITTNIYICVHLHPAYRSTTVIITDIYILHVTTPS